MTVTLPRARLGVSTIYESTTYDLALQVLVTVQHSLGSLPKETGSYLLMSLISSGVGFVGAALAPWFTESKRWKHA